MSDQADVLVAGAGPGGLYLAMRLAQQGVRTIVCEEHSGIGDPVHCTGVLAADSFREFDLPDAAILKQLTRVRFVSPGGIAVDYATAAALANVIDRQAFERTLAERATAAGADIRHSARVSAIDIDRDGVRATVGHD